jgi:hypothetical protein
MELVLRNANATTTNNTAISQPDSHLWLSKGIWNLAKVSCCAQKSKKNLLKILPNPEENHLGRVLDLCKIKGRKQQSSRYNRVMKYNINGARFEEHQHDDDDDE